VWEIFELLHPKPDDLISPERFFVREGEMMMWDEKKKKKKKRYFFLFNDVILLCRRETHKRYWLRIHITLRSPHVSVEDIDNSSFNNEFRVHCRARTFILYASTPDQKKEWIQDLRHSIAGSHPDEKKKDTKHDEKDDKKEEVRKTKKEPKKEKPPESESESSEEPTPKKKPETVAKSKTRKGSKPPKQEIMPFDPFGPGGQMAGNPFNQNMKQGPVGNPFLPGNPQPNIITTAPLAGGPNFGFNQGIQPNANMGYNNQAGFNANANMGYNPNINPGLNANIGYNPNVNPGLNANIGFNNQAGFNANANMGYNPNVNPGLNANLAFNPFAGNTQPVVTGTNPFTAAPVQRQPTGGNTNPFLNNNGPFTNQNPLF
jgi:hypothetical protein